MKKLLFLLPIFTFAACGNLELVFSSSAGAADGGAGGSGGQSTCQCDDTGMKSGQRLQVTWLEGEDGSRAHSGKFIDTKTNLICSFQTLPNSETRCVPDHVVQNYYIDSSCTTPVFVKRWCNGNAPAVCKSEYANIDCVPTGHFVRIDEFAPDAACFGKNVGFKMFAIDTGNKLNGVGAIYSVANDGSCIFAGGSGAYDYEHYALFQVGTSDDFVKTISEP